MRRLARNPARLVFCRTCHVGHWLDGAMPAESDATYVCAPCAEKAAEKLTAGAQELGRMAAEIDGPEGGHRALLNLVDLLLWAGDIKAEHHRCGRLALETDENAYAVAITCPAHGRFEAPEWQEASA